MISDNRAQCCDCPTNVVVRYTGKQREQAWKIDRELAAIMDRVDYFCEGRGEGTMPSTQNFDELLKHTQFLIGRLNP